MNVLLIINARSGIRNSKSQLLEVLDVFSRNGYEVTVHVTQKGGDAEAYLLKSRKHYDIVCVMGGDGTMNEVSNALMRKKNRPLIGYFPSGTMNDFGSNFDLGSDFVKIAEKICKGRVREFDVGEFNGRCFNYVAAFGAMCDVPFTTARESKELLGNIAYIIEGISRLPEVKPSHVNYTVNGETYESDVLFGLIYSGSRVAGMQLETKRKAAVDDGLFNVLIVDYVPSFLEAPDLLTTLLQQDRYIHRFRTDQISFTFNEKIIWTLDGEEAKVKNKANIRIHNKALRLIA